MKRIKHRSRSKGRVIIPVKTHITPDHIKVTAQGNLLKVEYKRAETHKRKGGGARGKVTAFTKQSRKRFLDIIARLDLKHAGYSCFITLTFPDRDGPPTFDAAYQSVRALEKRLTRLYPNFSALWRREWQDRKSGQFIGVLYPHFHLVVFGLPFLPAEDLNRMWAEVLKYDGYVRTEIKGIENRAMMIGYVAKYAAKLDAAPGGGSGAPQPEPDAGDALVCEEAPQDGEAYHVGEADGSLVYVTYQATEEKEEETPPKPDEASMGRAWGCFNRKKLPFAEKKEATLEPGEWLETYKAYGREKWPGVNDDPMLGFTLFVENPEEWLGLAAMLEKASKAKENDGLAAREGGEDA